MVRKIIKKVQEIFYKPLVLWYLRKERTFNYEGLKVNIKPGIFHPGLFYSTKILLRFLKTQPIKNKSFLEPGCGSGLISVWAAKQGAVVTAFDINPMAVENTIENSVLNNQHIRVVQSSLFTNIDPTIFDYIIINPPFYPNDPTTPQDFAWYCGADHEYFRELFRDLPSYCDSNSMVIIVLSEDCNRQAITEIAQRYGHSLQLIDVSKSLLETGYLYRF